LSTIVIGAALVLSSATAISSPFNGKQEDAPVNFQAKELYHDDKAQTVTAIGDVELVQGDRILHADKMVYNLQTDTVSAIGNVSLLDDNGDVHFSEYVELNKSMKDGYVHSLLSLLNDGTRFTADEAKREGGVKLTMTDATYTPCKVCEDDPKPLWQLKATKVVHDEVEKTVKYENARLELLGVPLAWSPIFSHADPSVKRKSGFLRPKYGWGSDTGTYVEGGYYFGDIKPNIDATLQVRPTSLKGTLVQGEWRQRFEQGKLKINGSTARSDRTERDGHVEQNKWRGHLFADGQYDINDKWRAGFGVERSSDKEYLRLYDISNKNVLENQAYAERFSGRDYTRISALSFQDIRLGVRPEQPVVFPEVDHQMLGAPNALWGGRWEAGASSLIMQRKDDGQDVQRASLNGGWERSHIFDSGISGKVRGSARGDFYSVQNRDAAVTDPTLDGSARAFRGTAVAQAEAGYPLVKRLDAAQVVVEPVVGGQVSPQVDQTDNRIPNEDSLEVQYDYTNLFDENHFAGVDRQEDGARVSYGLKTGVYGDEGNYAKFNIGQSYRFDDDGLFPAGSGMEENLADVVGLVGVGLGKAFDADYRFRLDNDTLAAKRHELRASGGTKDLRLNTRYIYADAIAGTGITDTREQVYFGVNYNLTQHWTASTTALTDLGEDAGLRRASVGFGYVDECFTFSGEGQRRFTNAGTGESETVVMLRVGFKNIGEFSSPQIELKTKQDSTQ